MASQTNPEESDLDRVARRSRLRRDDRDVAAGDGVHQRRFADIGRPSDNDMKALAQPLAGPRRGERLADAPGRRQREAARFLEAGEFGILLVGKIDLRFGLRHRFDEQRADRIRLA